MRLAEKNGEGPPRSEGSRWGPGVRRKQHTAPAHLCAPKSGPHPKDVWACAYLLETHPGFLAGRRGLRMSRSGGAVACG